MQLRMPNVHKDTGLYLCLFMGAIMFSNEIKVFHYCDGETMKTVLDSIKDATSGYALHTMVDASQFETRIILIENE